MGKIIIEASSLSDLQNTLTAFRIPLNNVGPSAEPIGGAQITGDDENGPVNSAAPDRDKNGLPWDERIHSANKGMNSDGTWRRKRNVQDAYFTQVEEELKKASATPQAQPTMPTAAPMAPMSMPQTSGMPPMMPTTQSAPMPSTQSAPLPDTNPSPPPMMPAAAPSMSMPATPSTNWQDNPHSGPSPDQPLTGNDFMMKLGKLMQMDNPEKPGEKMVEPSYVQQICAWQQLNAITDLIAQPNKIPDIVEQFKRDRKWLA